MTDAVDPGTSAPVPPTTAGALIRQRREQRGIHVAMLAATLKVSTRRLEALERDDHRDMPDINFVRALTKSVCRQLQMDDQPVLALLPRATDGDLAKVGAGLHHPFRDRPERASPGVTRGHPLRLAGILVVLMAAAAFVLQSSESWWKPMSRGQDTSVAAGSSGSSAQPSAALAAPKAASGPRVEIVQSAGPTDYPREDAASLTVTEPSWVEILDAAEQPLFARLVQPGESLLLDVRQPLRLKVGNARATQVLLRGKPVDLMAAARDNVTRVELQ